MALSHDMLEHTAMPMWVYEVIYIYDTAAEVVTGYAIKPIKILAYDYAAPDCTAKTIQFRDHDGRLCRGSGDLYYATPEAARAALVDRLREALVTNAQQTMKLANQRRHIELMLKRLS